MGTSASLDLKNKGFIVKQAIEKLSEIEKEGALDMLGFPSTSAFILQLGAANHSCNLCLLGKISEDLALRLVTTFLNTFESHVKNVLEFDLEDL